MSSIEPRSGCSTPVNTLMSVDLPAPFSPHHAQQLGISSVYQEVNLCTNLTVAENILLGREPRRFGGIDWRRMNAQAEQALARLDLTIDVRQPLGSYSLAIRQMIAIARSLVISDASILI